MSFARFSKSQRYGSRVPLRNLAFRVTVSRASVVEESHTEELCCVTVPWDGKVLSPSERIELFEGVQDALARDAFGRPTVDGQAKPIVTPAGDVVAASPQAKLALVDGLAAAPDLFSATLSGVVPLSSLYNDGDRDRQHPSLTAQAAGRTMPFTGAPTNASFSGPAGWSVKDMYAALVHLLRQPGCGLFTRPTTEDYIDAAEEEVPFEPPLVGASRLASVVLRQHRKDHQPNNRMFFMWAFGELHGVSASRLRERATSPALPGDIPAAEETKPNVEKDNQVPAHDEAKQQGRSGRQTANTDDSVDGPLRWSGEEMVMCTITAERDECFFTAKPSLGEVHTLVVDSLYIYSFLIEAVPRDEANTNAPSTAGVQSAMSGTGVTGGVRPSTATAAAAAVATAAPLSPAEDAAERVRQLSTSVTAQVSRLRLNKEAAARAMLREAALRLPDSAASTHPSSVGETGGGKPDTATSAAAGLSDGGGTGLRHRKASGEEPFSTALVAEGSRPWLSSALPNRSVSFSTTVTPPMSAAARGGGLLGSSFSMAGAGMSMTMGRGTTAHGVAARDAATSGVGGGVSPSSTASPATRCQYYVCGVVERCVGVVQDTLLLRCEVLRDVLPYSKLTVQETASSSTGQHRRNDHYLTNPAGAASLRYLRVRTSFDENEDSEDDFSDKDGEDYDRRRLPRQQKQQQQHHPRDSADARVEAIEPELTFTTQLAFAGRVVRDDFYLDVDHVFNFPFEISYFDTVVPRSPLRLSITAFTEGAGADGLQTPVGYCSLTLPVASAGRHRVEAPLWVPHKTGKELVKAVLTGGGPALVDSRQSGPPLLPHQRTGIAVKEGMMTDPTGTVQVTVNVVKQPCGV